MRITITILKYTSLIFGALSFVFLVTALTNHISYDPIVTFSNSVDNVYNAAIIYSGLYKFTILIVALWATLTRIDLSESSLQHIEDNQNKDINSETLKLCYKYLTDFQDSYKDLTELDGTRTRWALLNEEYTRANFQAIYRRSFQRFNNAGKPQKDQIILTLNKFEAVSALFMHGNLDKELGKKIIGHTYVTQIGTLLGAISYFRSEVSPLFGQNIIDLYSIWNNEEEIN